MKMTVKRWIADQKDAEAKKHNMFPDVVYVKDENGIDFYADLKNDTVTYEDAEIVRETEKAVLASLYCGACGGKTGRKF